MTPKQVTVLGAGAWGTAVALLLARNGADVLLWAREADVVDDINTNHRNQRFLPNNNLPNNLRATSDLALACQHSTLLFEAIPTAYLSGILDQCAPHLRQGHRLVILSKGIEQESLLLPSQLIAQHAGQTILCAVLAGPSFAVELAQEQITGLTVACNDRHLKDTIKSLIANSYVMLTYNSDVIGVQAGGAVKNVLALASGILHGLGGGSNATALLLTKGLKEVSQILEALGGSHATAYGLAGLGDLILTCTSPQSKNFSYGLALGKGTSKEMLATQFPTPPEGVNTANTIMHLRDKYHLLLPLCTAAQQVLAGTHKPLHLLDALRGITTE